MPVGTETLPPDQFTNNSKAIREGVQDKWDNFGGLGIGDWIFGALEHTALNLAKINTMPMLTSLLCIIIGFTFLNAAIGEHIPEIRSSRNEGDKLVSSFYVTIQLLTFRSLKEPPTSSVGKIIIVVQQIIFFLILLFFFQHIGGAWTWRRWTNTAAP